MKFQIIGTLLFTQTATLDSEVLEISETFAESCRANAVRRAHKILRRYGASGPPGSTLVADVDLVRVSPVRAIRETIQPAVQ